MAEQPFDTRTASVSERGRRSVNQDAALLTTLADGSELAALADGMGGHSGGAVASALALEALHVALDAGSDLVAAVRAANDAVLLEAGRRTELHGMGTTIVAVLRRGDAYTVANVGDSRAYRIDAASVVQLTQDHSFVAEAIRSGGLSAEEAGRSQWRNAVTRAVGTGASVDVDCFGPFEIDSPHTLLLCTDGLYRAVGDDELQAAVLDAEPAAAARRLVDAALAGGSDDNVSITLLSVAAATSAAREPSLRTDMDAEPGAQDRSGLRSFLAAQAPSPPRRRRRKTARRWTLRETGIIFGVAALVILYVALMRSIF